MSSKVRDCVPVLRGKIYCSSACGYGCTKRSYDEAVKAAGELTQRLERLSCGWTSEIFENFGWCYKVTSGPVVFESGYPVSVVSCFISEHDVDPSRHGGSPIWTIAEVNRDPILAATRQLDYAIESVSELLRIVFKAGRILGLSPSEIWPALLYNPPPEVKGDDHE
jgi:hypothetical protein